MRPGVLSTEVIWELRLGKNKLLESVHHTYDEADEYYKLLVRELHVTAQKHIIPVPKHPDEDSPDFV